MNYTKYQALGNDYIVIHPDEARSGLSAELIRRICHRRYGVGSDGILLGPLPSLVADFGLRIFNPDGSEAELSGNGLRIFARAIVDDGLTGDLSFTVETGGRVVHCRVAPDSRTVTVDLGLVSFDSAVIPVAGPRREVLNEALEIDGEQLSYCAASIGNPHCVVLVENPVPAAARRFGPLIEREPRFPNRTNVQFMRVIDRATIQIEIWERGAGYTLASGSSSAAAAAVASKLGLCDAYITVHMPGGEIEVQLGENFSARITGPVGKISSGRIAPELVGQDSILPRALRARTTPGN